MENKIVVRFVVKTEAQRHSLLASLADSGYKVWVEDNKTNSITSTASVTYVCVEINNYALM